MIDQKSLPHFKFLIQYFFSKVNGSTKACQGIYATRPFKSLIIGDATLEIKRIFSQLKHLKPKKVQDHTKSDSDFGRSIIELSKPPSTQTVRSTKTKLYCCIPFVGESSSLLIERDIDNIISDSNNRDEYSDSIKLRKLYFYATLVRNISTAALACFTMKSGLDCFIKIAIVINSMTDIFAGKLKIDLDDTCKIVVLQTRFFRFTKNLIDNASSKNYNEFQKVFAALGNLNNEIIKEFNRSNRTY